MIAEAARAAFVESGWSGTSMRAVARAAGVSEATVYAVFGSKAGVALSLVDSADASANVERVLAELAASEGDPKAQLAAIIRFDRRLYESSGDVVRLVVEGARHQPEIAAAHAEGRKRGNENRRRVFSSWPESVWAPGFDVQRALDVYSMTVSIATYDEAVVWRGWSPDDVETWWCESLPRLLFAQEQH